MGTWVSGAVPLGEESFPAASAPNGFLAAAVSGSGNRLPAGIRSGRAKSGKYRRCCFREAERQRRGLTGVGTVRIRAVLPLALAPNSPAAICGAVAALLVTAAIARAADAGRPPNVVLVMTDNQGAWTLGCYGNREIKTPNIDRMAAEGMLFTRAYCTHSLCSPSRATFLTGLIPSQHGLHYVVPEPGEADPSAATRPCAIREFETLPKVLSRAGFVCGLSGKWHLGGFLHPQAGFRYWFTMPGGHTLTYYGAEVVWQGKIQKEPRYLTDAITDHAVDFIRQNRDRRFFLLLTYDAPYGVSSCFTRTHENRHTAFYADKPLNCFPREKIHPSQKHRLELINNNVAIRGYAAAVSGVDDGVGTILKTLADLGIEKETLVIFTADQGFNGGHGGMWGLGEHTDPVNTREPLVRIPLIVRQPGRVLSHAVSDHVIASYDLLPTVLSHLGLSERKPSNPRLPGRDFSPLLAGRTIAWDDVAFHEFDRTRMIRTPRWKLTRRYPGGPDELYDMQNDPQERQNLVAQPAGARVLHSLNERLQQFFDGFADPKYDRTRNGKSKFEPYLIFK
jgi:arylsulfatase A-like enzyme